VNLNNFTKKDFIKSLSEKSGFSLNLSKKLINDFLDVLIHNIKSNNLLLKNIGTFKLIKKKQRLGRNPKTKEEFIIYSRISLSFQPSKKILNKLNSTYE
jgi:integration host factor subunit alpha|tara:strand:+ start:905 stop:1201 length:297 start_codon:yes stop_codon:yes gene_type:complete